MAKLDLHCHSTASDGALPPAELVARAAARGSRMLALTDHDCTAGLAEAGEAAREHGLDLIRGVEISVSWRTRTIHIVGLDIDPDCPALAAGLRAVREGRVERARRHAAASSDQAARSRASVSARGIIRRTTASVPSGSRARASAM